MLNQKTELPLRARKADAPVCVYIHYEAGESRQTVQVKHRTRNARLQVSVNGAYRNVPRRGYFKFDDGTIGRVQMVKQAAPPRALSTDELAETLRNRYRRTPWHRGR